jgi:polysaccharide export outer membrane protein
MWSRIRQLIPPALVAFLLLPACVPITSVAQERSADSPNTAGEPAQASPAPSTSGTDSAPAQTADAPRPQVSSGGVANRPKLLIGPGDEGEFSVYGVTELTQKFRVSSTGYISVPLIGEVRLAGLSSSEAEQLIAKKLQEGEFIRDPHVTVFVKDYASQGISVMGEVARPGAYSALTSRRLYDLFQAAGGLTQRAGKTVTIAHAGQNQKALTIELSDDPAQAAEANVEVLPGDTVVVSRAGVVYVLGEVNRPGGFVVEDKPVTVLQALARANGPTRMASLSHVRMLRHTPQGVQNTDIDLKKIFQAKAPDVPLQAEDILFVPASGTKALAERGSSSILSMITNLAIYRF